jgi:hypothetical protein
MIRHTSHELLEPSIMEGREREREKERGEGEGGREREKDGADWRTFIQQLEEGFDDVQVEGSAPRTSYEFSRPPTQNSRVDPIQANDICCIV